MTCVNDLHRSSRSPVDFQNQMRSIASICDKAGCDVIMFMRIYVNTFVCPVTSTPGLRKGGREGRRCLGLHLCQHSV